MPLLNLDTLDATPLQREPFDYLVVPDFLTPEALAAANRDYPQISTPGNKDLEALQYGTGFASLIDALTGHEFTRHIGAKFGVDLDDAVTTVTVRKYSEASDGNIHTDHWSKLITVLVYFNTDWDEQSGQLRLLRSATDLEDYAAEVPPAGGTLLAFRRTRNSWHGHKRFVGERRMLQLNFIRNSRLARFTQQAARFSTRMVKQLSRIARPDQAGDSDRPTNT
jgi:hypothetical protein